jgi:hypothetical protein
MSEPVNDLWGDLAVESTPADVLHEQADALGQKTKNLLEGLLLTEIVKQSVRVRFAVRAPTLGYQTTLFEVKYTMLMPFPCDIEEHLTLEEYQLDDMYGGQMKMNRKRLTQASDDAELRQRVKDVLQSDNVRKLVSGLLSAVRNS